MKQHSMHHRSVSQVALLLGADAVSGGSREEKPMEFAFIRPGEQEQPVCPQGTPYELHSSSSFMRETHHCVNSNRGNTRHTRYAVLKRNEKPPAPEIHNGGVPRGGDSGYPCATGPEQEESSGPRGAGEQTPHGRSSSQKRPQRGPIPVVGIHKSSFECLLQKSAAAKQAYFNAATASGDELIRASAEIEAAGLSSNRFNFSPRRRTDDPWSGAKSAESQELVAALHSRLWEAPSQRTAPHFLVSKDYVDKDLPKGPPKEKPPPPAGSPPCSTRTGGSRHSHSRRSSLLTSGSAPVGVSQHYYSSKKSRPGTATSSGRPSRPSSARTAWTGSRPASANTYSRGIYSHPASARQWVSSSPGHPNPPPAGAPVHDPTREQVGIKPGQGVASPGPVLPPPRRPQSAPSRRRPASARSCYSQGQYPRPEGGLGGARSGPSTHRPLSAGGTRTSSSYSEVYNGQSPAAIAIARLSGDYPVGQTLAPGVSVEDGEYGASTEGYGGAPSGRRWSEARNGREASVLLEPAVGHATMRLFGSGNGTPLAPARFGAAFLNMPEALDSGVDHALLVP